MSAAVAAIEALAFRAWPAEEEVEMGGWMLRRSPGLAARRINSATSPIGPPARPVAEMEGMIARWFVERGADPVVRMLSTSSADIDGYFSANGWERESPTLVLTGPIRELDAAELDRVDGVATGEWAAAKRRLTGMSDEVLATWRRRAAAIEGATGFASLHRNGRCVAIGLGVVDDGWLGLFDLNTDPVYRRRGLATSIVRGLEHWAAAQGATRAYLQVEAANDAALALYRREGYGQQYTYWYRRAPSPA